MCLCVAVIPLSCMNRASYWRTSHVARSLRIPKHERVLVPLQGDQAIEEYEDDHWQSEEDQEDEAGASETQSPTVQPGGSKKKRKSRAKTKMVPARKEQLPEAALKPVMRMFTNVTKYKAQSVRVQ